MSEIDPPARSIEQVLCCCVLVDKAEGATLVDREIICNLETTGPDDPFCSECSDRHISHPGVVYGHLEVTAKMREKDSA